MVRELKFEKIIETCIYSTDLNVMKDFYVNRLGLESDLGGGRETCILESWKKYAFNFQSRKYKVSSPIVTFQYMVP